MNRIHGKATTKVYMAWKDMKRRCVASNRIRSRHWGGRGIKVLWTSFEEFYADMGDPPKGTQLDRIDNDGHYSKGNCRWATSRQQNNNKRNNVLISYNGKTLTIPEWARLIDIPYFTLWARIRRDEWSIEKAFTTPVRYIDKMPTTPLAHNGQHSATAKSIQKTTAEDMEVPF